MTLAVTGHRPDKLNSEWDGEGLLSRLIYKELGDIIERNPDCVCISGMALGVDTIFAQAAIDNRRRLVAAIPFYGQESKWSTKQKVKYEYLTHHHLCRIEVINPYYPTTYRLAAQWLQERNEFMVNRCDGLIAVWDRSSGGTANCVKYAFGKRPIIWINPKESKLVQRKLLSL